MKKIGKRSLESLSCSGAFDELVDSREKCFSSIDKIVSYSESIFVEKNTKQSNFFSDDSNFAIEPTLYEKEEFPLQTSDSTNEVI